MPGIARTFQRSQFSSALTQCNGKRDHDHAGKCKIEIHEIFFILTIRMGGILHSSRTNEKFGFMI
jgi:hypothetical protein